MANQQLLDYINQQIKEGVNKEEIKGALISSGWTHKDVEEAFTATQTTATPLSSSVPVSSLEVASAPQPAALQETAPVDFYGIFSLFGSTWNLYKQRAWEI